MGGEPTVSGHFQCSSTKRLIIFLFHLLCTGAAEVSLLVSASLFLDLDSTGESDDELDLRSICSNPSPRPSPTHTVSQSHDLSLYSHPDVSVQNVANLKEPI